MLKNRRFSVERINQRLDRTGKIVRSVGHVEEYELSLADEITGIFTEAGGMYVPTSRCPNLDEQERMAR